MNAEASSAEAARPAPTALTTPAVLTPPTALHAIARFALAALMLAGVVQQYLWGLDGTSEVGGYTANYFSYFTIESNVLGVITLVLCAGAGLRGRLPGWLCVLTACSTSYLLTTGVVYNALLRQIAADGALGSSWPNETAHLVGPALVLLDWVLSSPGMRLRWRTLWAVAAYPVAWLVYTMVRGAATGFYPYPFLEPDQPGGIAALAGYIVGISAFIVASGAGVVALSRRRGRAAEAAARPELSR